MTLLEFNEDLKLLNYSIEKRKYYYDLVFNYLVFINKITNGSYLNYQSIYITVNNKVQMTSEKEMVVEGLSGGYFFNNKKTYIHVKKEDVYNFYNLLERRKKLEEIKNKINRKKKFSFKKLLKIWTLKR